MTLQRNSPRPIPQSSVRELPPPNCGFSLIEFLLAAFIFAIGVLGLTALQIGSLKQTSMSRGRITATYIVEHVLQQAQMEGQQSYSAKLQNQTSPLSLFTASPGQAIADHPFASFNVDGVHVVDIQAAARSEVPNLAARVPDLNKRPFMDTTDPNHPEGILTSVFTASWSRKAYLDPAPFTAANAATVAHCQEFIVNVTWKENGIDKYLSVSRNIRY